MSITLTVKANEDGEIKLKHPMIHPEELVQVTLKSPQRDDEESLAVLIEKLRSKDPLPGRSIEDIDAQIRWVRNTDE